MSARPDPRLFVTPQTAAAIEQLTLGQIMRLLQARRGDVARAWIAELKISAPDDFIGPTAEDTCTIVSLGLMVLARGDYRLTEKGGHWLDVILETASSARRT